MIAAARLPDWPVRFQALVAQRQRAPFVWGVHDCCLFAADCVQACTGVDPALGLRGTYRSARQAARLMAAAGGLGALAARCLGPEIRPTLAACGDVGLAFPADGPPVLAVNNGVHWIAPSAHGLVPVPTPRRAWRAARA